MWWVGGWSKVGCGGWRWCVKGMGWVVCVWKGFGVGVGYGGVWRRSGWAGGVGLCRTGVVWVGVERVEWGRVQCVGVVD